MNDTQGGVSELFELWYTLEFATQTRGHFIHTINLGKLRKCPVTEPTGETDSPHLLQQAPSTPAQRVDLYLFPPLGGGEPHSFHKTLVEIWVVKIAALLRDLTDGH